MDVHPLRERYRYTIDDLSSAARQIARGNFAWRTPVRSKDQLGDLSCSFNEMAIALEQLQKDEAARLRLDSELQVARTVQRYLTRALRPCCVGPPFQAERWRRERLGAICTISSISVGNESGSFVRT